MYSNWVVNLHMPKKLTSMYCNLIWFCALQLLLLPKMYVAKVFTCLPQMVPTVLRVNALIKIQ